MSVVCAQNHSTAVSTGSRPVPMTLPEDRQKGGMRQRGVASTLSDATKLHDADDGRTGSLGAGTKEKSLQRMQPAQEWLGSQAKSRCAHSLCRTRNLHGAGTQAEGMLMLQQLDACMHEEPTMTPPAVSKPRDSGATSSSSTSLMASLPSPDRMAACTAAP